MTFLEKCSRFYPELGLIIIYSLLYYYSIEIVRLTIPSYVHNLKSFEELSDSLISCSYDTKNATNLNQCLIEENKLNHIDNINPSESFDYKHIKLGGKFEPIGCRTRQKVSIVIPYRNREEHLEKFSHYIHQFLQSQQFEYTVFVIEQTKSKSFNRAKLFNAGVAEIRKLDPEICCFIFHDVDLLPLNQKNLYMCSNLPKHLSVGVSSLRYRLLYPTLFGGVTALTKEHFDKIGGFSNEFYGWGGEDDDIFNRIRRANLSILRTPEQYGLYESMNHPKMSPNPTR